MRSAASVSGCSEAGSGGGDLRLPPGLFLPSAGDLEENS